MYEIQEMITKEKIKERIDELARKLNEDFDGKELYVICILKGSVIFTCDLIRKLDIPIVLDFLIASSYGKKLISSGIVHIKHKPEVDLKNKEVLIIDDIIDTGYTLKKVVRKTLKQKPKAIYTCTLFDKRERRKVDFDVDYAGFLIPDEFIVGYGLDYDEKYRNLPYVGKMKTLKK